MQKHTSNTGRLKDTKKKMKRQSGVMKYVFEGFTGLFKVFSFKGFEGLRVLKSMVMTSWLLKTTYEVDLAYITSGPEGMQWLWFLYIKISPAKSILRKKRFVVFFLFFCFSFFFSLSKCAGIVRWLFLSCAREVDSFEGGSYLAKTRRKTTPSKIHSAHIFKVIKIPYFFRRTS